MTASSLQGCSIREVSSDSVNAMTLCKIMHDDDTLNQNFN